LYPGALDGDEHVVLIGGYENLLVFGLDPEEGEIVGGIKVPDHASGLLGE
jgi:hypothetical protein